MTRTAVVRPHFEATFREYGLLRAIRTDNGSPLFGVYADTVGLLAREPGYMSDIERQSAQTLVLMYENAAREHGNLTVAPDRANEAYQLVTNIVRELRRRGVEAQRALRPLLENGDLNVCVMAASHALEFAPSDGEGALERIAGGPRGVARLNAEMTLLQWRKGALRFP